MKKFSFIPFLLISQMAFAGIDDFEFGDSAQPTSLEINNRILLKINDKAISVMDLVRRMDVVFYRNFPEYVGIPAAKYQFYVTNYRTILDLMIDDELILADAVEKKIEVTDGDIREEMESLFGPTVVLNLHKAGLTFEEAWKLLKEELIVKRMSSMMVRSRAMLDVHPSKAREAYEKMEKKGGESWVYRVMTIESEDMENAKNAAQMAYQSLTEEKLSIDEVLARLKEAPVTARLSDEFCREENDISTAHKAILAQVAVGNYSLPEIQASKKEGICSWRIFYLKEKKTVPSLQFNEVAEKIIANLTQEATNNHRKSYAQKLRDRFGITENYLSQIMPKDFEPFVLR